MNRASIELMIPEDKIAGVSRGLKEAFGAAEFDEIRDLTERPGSNRAYRMVVGGSVYLLRINTRPGDMARHFHCMEAAAAAGLAPRVRYANIEDRISITDYVEAVPFPAADALRRVPATLRALHALPAFPFAPFNTTCTFLLKESPAREGFLEKFRTSKMVPGSEVEGVLAEFTRIAAALAVSGPDLAPSHNDLFKPDNMLFDGRRLWLVDWEAAFQNDRYADLAVAANMLVADAADEQVYLQEYFGAAPTRYQTARFHLVRQLAHIFYALAFLMQGSAAEPIEWTEPAAEYHEFQRRFWSREIGLQEGRAKVLYGRVHWEELRHNLGQPRFAEALRIVEQEAGS